MKFDMAGVSVTLAMPAHRDIPPWTVRSLLETQAECLMRGIGIDIEMGQGSSLVHHARTKAAWAFLQGNRSRLFWVDSDIDWQAADFLRLLALSTVKPVVAGLYPCKSDPPEFLVSPLGIGEEVETDEYGCIPVLGLGLGFCCVTRSVIEELAAKAPLARFPDVNGGEPVPHIFRCDIHDGYARGEDMAFFADIRALGHEISVAPTVSLGHVGPKVFRGSLADHLVKTGD